MSDERPPNRRVRIHWRLGDKEGVYEDPPESPTLWQDDSGVNYWMWEEGNYACDCNRSTFFGLDKVSCGDKIEIVSMDAIPERDVR